MRLKVSLSAAALALAGFSPAMAAQGATTAAFTPDQAAKCTATFEWIIRFLQPGGTESEEDIRRFNVQNELSAMMWTWELYDAMGEAATDEQLEAKFQSGADALMAEFPAEDGPDANNQVVQAVMSNAKTCNTLLTAQYPDGNHPLLEELEAEAAAAPAPAQ